MLHVKEVKHISNKIIWVLLNDGTAGEIDLDGKLKGPIFEELNDESLFAEAYLDREAETVAWPNGADLAPEYLKELLLERGNDSQRLQG